MDKYNAARQIVKVSKSNIQNHLLNTGIMFEEQFNQTIVRSVADIIPEIIKEEFGLTDLIIICRSEEIKNDYKYIYYTVEFAERMGNEFLEEMIKSHYE